MCIFLFCFQILIFLYKWQCIAKNFKSFSLKQISKIRENHHKRNHFNLIGVKDGWCSPMDMKSSTILLKSSFCKLKKSLWCYQVYTNILGFPLCLCKTQTPWEGGNIGCDYIVSNFSLDLVSEIHLSTKLELMMNQESTPVTWVVLGFQVCMRRKSHVL
jgi:hypothetical protein